MQKSHVVALALAVPLALLTTCSRRPEATGPYASLIEHHCGRIERGDNSFGDADMWLSMAGPDAAAVVGPWVLHKTPGTARSACEILDSLDRMAAGALPSLVKALRHRLPDEGRYDRYGQVRRWCVRVLGDIGQPAVQALKENGLGEGDDYADVLTRIALYRAGETQAATRLLKDLENPAYADACGPAIVEALCRGTIPPQVRYGLLATARVWISEEKSIHSHGDEYETMVAIARSLGRLGKDMKELGPLLIGLADQGGDLGDAACSSMVDAGKPFAAWLAAGASEQCITYAKVLSRMGPAAAPVVPTIIAYLNDSASRRSPGAAVALLDSIGYPARSAAPVLRRLFRKEWEVSYPSEYRLNGVAQALASVDPALAAQEFVRCAQSTSSMGDTREIALARGIARCGTRGAAALDWLLTEVASAKHKLESDFVFELQKTLFSVAPDDPRAQSAMLSSMLGFSRFDEELQVVSAEKFALMRSQFFEMDKDEIRDARRNVDMANAIWEDPNALGDPMEMSRSMLDSVRTFLSDAGVLELVDGNDFIAFVEQFGIDSAYKTYELLSSLGARAEPAMAQIARTHERWEARLLALQLLLQLDAIRPATAQALRSVLEREKAYGRVAAAACLMKHGYGTKRTASIVHAALMQRDPTMQWYAVMGLSRESVHDTLLPYVQQALQSGAPAVQHAVARLLRDGRGDPIKRLAVLHASFDDVKSYTARAACGAACLALAPGDSIGLDQYISAIRVVDSDSVARRDSIVAIGAELLTNSPPRQLAALVSTAVTFPDYMLSALTAFLRDHGTPNLAMASVAVIESGSPYAKLFAAHLLRRMPVETPSSVVKVLKKLEQGSDAAVAYAANIALSRDSR